MQVVLEEAKRRFSTAVKNRGVDDRFLEIYQNDTKSNYSEGVSQTDKQGCIFTHFLKCFIMY